MFSTSSLRVIVYIPRCLFDLRSEQVVISSQIPAQHYLPSPGDATYVIPHRPVYSQAAATPGLLPQREFIILLLFVHACNIITFKSLAGLSSFTYGYQPPHLTPSTSSSWPQSKSTMHACRIFSKVYIILWHVATIV